MSDIQTPGGFTGDPTAAAAAAPCCGTATDAAAEGSCCGSTAKADAVASGQGCCG